MLRGLFVLPLRYSTNVPLHKTPLMLALCAREMTINESRLDSSKERNAPDFLISFPRSAWERMLNTPTLSIGARYKIIEIPAYAGMTVWNVCRFINKKALCNSVSSV